MPTQSLRECNYPGCHVLVHHGRCARHDSKRVARDPAVKKLYNSKRWRVLRSEQLGRSPWCVECLSGGSHVFATEVDHVTPHRGDASLFFDAKNLQSLCKRHHSQKTAEEVLHP